MMQGAPPAAVAVRSLTTTQDNDTAQTFFVSGFGATMLLVLCCLSWRTIMDYCRGPPHSARHRAFAKRSSPSWLCQTCYHANDEAQKRCVLCGTPPEVLNLVIDQPIVVDDSSSDDFHLMETPTMGGSTVPNGSHFHLNEQQQMALERHEWKRCIDKHAVRWVQVEPVALRTNENIRGSLISIKDLEGKKTKKTPKLTTLHPEEQNPKTLVPVTPPVVSVDGGAFFVRDNRPESIVKWCPVERIVVPVRSSDYTRKIQRVAHLEFSDKVLWLYASFFRISASNEGYHTIRVHREHVLKQSFDLLHTATTTLLRRRLRVDFLDEPGIDGGGILREWLHLICTEVFSESLGLFQLTESLTHPGYWINRQASARCRNHLDMFFFMGKVLGKALLEGLVLNVRLSVPLLKHILGTPMSLADIKHIDPQLHQSLAWILANVNTDSLCLNFVVEGRELIPNGQSITLHDGNKHLYVQKVVEYYLFSSVEVEIDRLLQGLHCIVPETMLHIFDYQELDLLLSGLPEIDTADWKANTEIRFLYERVEQETAVVEWFWEIVESFTQEQRGRLLQYVTGSSGVPVEGFQGLVGMDGDIQHFTIQLSSIASKGFTMLPHASTCLNRLDLPIYSSKEELQEILEMIIQMDVTGFNRS